MKPRAHLENWSLANPDAYTAPEIQVGVGVVTGHTKFSDGAKIKTGLVAKLDLEHKTLETHNTVYNLGLPDPDWIRWLDRNGFRMVRQTWPDPLPPVETPA